MDSAGARFRQALAKENPLQIVGTINAISALIAKEIGFLSLYLSGAGVANACYGLPDLALTTLTEVTEEVRRITACVDLPLLVDIDTGWGSALNIERTIKSMIQAGAAAAHIEDQVSAKRCGHRPGKQLVETTEMVDRLKSALDARSDPEFVIMARTDALATEGLEKTCERIHAYLATGADMIFLEGAHTLAEYQAVTQRFKKPILANITEFGVTPLFTKEELTRVGIQLILYPLSAFRAMNAATYQTYHAIRTTGTQSSMVPAMQTREDLYRLLHYHTYEETLDRLFHKENKHG